MRWTFSGWWHTFAATGVVMNVSVLRAGVIVVVVCATATAPACSCDTPAQSGEIPEGGRDKPNDFLDCQANLPAEIDAATSEKLKGELRAFLIEPPMKGAVGAERTTETRLRGVYQRLDAKDMQCAMKLNTALCVAKIDRSQAGHVLELIDTFCPVMLGAPPPSSTPVAPCTPPCASADAGTAGVPDPPPSVTASARAATRPPSTRCPACSTATASGCKLPASPSRACAVALAAHCRRSDRNVSLCSDFQASGLAWAIGEANDAGTLLDLAE